MSHTPGPWNIAETFGDGRRTTKQVNIRPVDDRNGDHGAVCCLVWGADSPECQANARLIAAAPELLEALESLLEAREDDSPATAFAVRQSAYRVIAKARNE